MIVKTPLQAARRQLGYAAEEVIDLLIKRAGMLNIPIMSRTSLKTKLSRWENGHEAVSLPDYRRLFRETYGRTNDELGFPPEPDDGEADELLSRLAAARTVDAATIALFRQQVDTARHVDRRFGAITVLDQLRSTITQIENLLTYSTNPSHRRQLAAVLAEASVLAGWEALDRSAMRQAWHHHERAKAAALEADSPPALRPLNGATSFHPDRPGRTRRRPRTTRQRPPTRRTIRAQTAALVVGRRSWRRSCRHWPTRRSPTCLRRRQFPPAQLPRRSRLAVRTAGAATRSLA